MVRRQFEEARVIVIFQTRVSLHLSQSCPNNLERLTFMHEQHCHEADVGNCEITSDLLIIR